MQQTQRFGGDAICYKPLVLKSIGTVLLLLFLSQFHYSYAQQVNPDSARKPEPDTLIPAAQAPAKMADRTVNSPAIAPSAQLGADSKSIKGTVVDEKGTEMPGVSVLIKNTQISDKKMAGK